MSLHLQKVSPRWLVGLTLTATLVTGSTVFYAFSQFRPGQNQPAAAEPVTPIPRRVAALGRLEPEAEVTQLSAPMALESDRLAELKVQAGDQVEVGQIVAVLDSRAQLADAVRQSEQQVQVAQAKLAQVQAGAKAGEIQAQRATISRLQADLAGEQATQSAEITRWQAETRTAQAELNRFQQLFQQGAIAASTLDEKRLTLETAQAQLRQAEAKQGQLGESLRAQIQQAEATLEQISEVRPVDVQIARTEVNEAIAGLERAQTDLEQANVRSPIAAQVLKIHTRPGEKLSDQGIVDLAQTAQMVAVAEVYQTDIGQIKVGQPAVITSPAFAGELQGTVSQIGLQVSRQNVFSNEPGENLDRRVVEVKIRLSPADSQKVTGLTHLQVQTSIAVESPLTLSSQPSSCLSFWITNDRFRSHGIC